jgi:hypothetical protein
MAVYKHQEPDTPGAGASDQACAALLKELRARCPGLVPADPLPPSGVGAEVPITPEALGPLVAVGLGLSRAGTRIRKRSAARPGSGGSLDGFDKPSPGIRKAVT